MKGNASESDNISVTRDTLEEGPLGPDASAKILSNTRAYAKASSRLASVYSIGLTSAAQRAAFSMTDSLSLSSGQFWIPAKAAEMGEGASGAGMDMITCFCTLK